MGELHLQIYAERLKREFDIPCDVGHPTVNYRETILEKTKFNFLHKKQSGGAGQYAKVIGYLEPTFENINDPANDLSCEFKDATVGTNIPNEYIPAIEKAFHQATEKGPFTGYPVVGVRYVLEDGQTHVVDSSSMAFAIATKNSFRDTFREADPKILEPIMDVEVSVPAEFQPNIMSGLVRRRGTVTDTRSSLDTFVLNADVPLAEMFGYATELRGATQGVGEFSMEYKNHSPVDEFQVQDIVDAHQKKLKEDD